MVILCLRHAHVRSVWGDRRARARTIEGGGCTRGGVCARSCAVGCSRGRGYSGVCAHPSTSELAVASVRLLATFFWTCATSAGVSHEMVNVSST